MRLVTKLMPSQKKVEEFEKKFPDYKGYYFEAIQGIFALSNELEKAMDHYFSGRCARFSRARFLVLIAVMLSDESRQTPNEIAKKLGVTRGNMTGLVDSLIEDGYVTKKQDADDRRQVWIEVTPVGRKFLEKILPNYFKRISKFMSGFKKDEIIQFTKTLGKFESGIDSAFSFEEESKK